MVGAGGMASISAAGGVGVASASASTTGSGVGAAGTIGSTATGADSAAIG